MCYILRFLFFSFCHFLTPFLNNIVNHSLHKSLKKCKWIFIYKNNIAQLETEVNLFLKKL
nr:MAG TPA: hypothetical protein [Caudoviricetes sp.]